MKIFNSIEEEAFDSPPVFNSVERKRFFSLPLMLEESIESLRTPINKICFLVTAGYFKACHKFFARLFRQTDIEYVGHQIGINPDEIGIDDYHKQTYTRHQHAILEYFGYTPFDKSAKSFIANGIEALVRVQFRPKLILLETIKILTQNKIEIPKYYVLADLIIAALNSRQQGLDKIIENHLSKHQYAKLDDLLEKEPGDGVEEGWRYRLTLLKKPNHTTRPSKIKTSLADLDTLQAIYLDIKSVVQHLNLSYECIRYYAYSVIKSQIPQISRRAVEDRYLHLIAFVVYQTFKLNDT
ncbi:MAG: DUF4158 domain-containing protein, partial [Parachlamydiaceae bacterium]|nr:DUF4158 domain-containing protein [Parachlamydiaceae bacterium]